MRLLPRCCRTAFLCLIVLSPSPTLAASRERPWALLAYGAIYTEDRLDDILTLRPSVEDSYLVALALNREFARTHRFLGWEGEGQVVKHFGDQDHFEFNALVVARWHHFPWNRRLDTTLAVGEGLSWATETPELEKENHSHATQMLNYLMFELTLAPPGSRWYWSGRIHHRSGVFGLFDGVHGASDFIGMGLGYRF
ncbi:MAG: hypothetical protein LJE63_04230 [Desulfobacteraceae bacterium]|jgi:hypothetical protein|nr:hypothetical protein [Desulfobacteraceae bacterium]